MNIFEKILNRIKLYCYKMKVLKLKLLGAKIGKNVKIYGNIYIIGYYQNLSVGDNSTLNHGVVLNLSDKIEIGNNVRISTYSTLHTGKLISNIIDQQTHKNLPIVIKDNVWIASSCVINGGVTIGKNSIIGANSYVNHDIEEYTLCAGSPAKIIKKKEKNELI